MLQEGKISPSLFQAVILFLLDLKENRAQLLHLQQPLKVLVFHPIQLTKGNTFKSQSDMFLGMKLSN